MELSAFDVQQKTFKERFRGYDPDDVEDFLDNVVETLRALEARTKRQQERVEQLERDLVNSSEAEEAIKRTFIAAQRTSQDMVTEAQEKAARVLERAREESDALLADSHSEAQSIRDKATEENSELLRRVARLRSAVGDLQGRLRNFAEGSLAELESVQTAIDLESHSLEELMEDGRAAEETPQEPVEVGEPEEPVALVTADEEALRDSDAADPDLTPMERMDRLTPDNTPEAAYLQQPRGQRPWDQKDGGEG